MAVDPDRIVKVPLFEGLSADELAAVADKLEERDLHVGEHLSSEGGAGYFFFVIESGRRRSGEARREGRRVRPR